MSQEPKHPERIEKSWPHYEEGEDRPVSELAAEVQGADAPYGDLHPPLHLERHGRIWKVREEGTERHDTEY